MAVAYFLDPLADRLEAWRCSRTVAVVIITLAFFLIVVLLIVLVVPLLQGQIIGLIRKIPALAETLTQWMAPFHEALEAQLGDDKKESLRALSESVAGTAAKWFIGLLGGIWQGGIALFNLVSLLFITPLVSFYLLRDWDRITVAVDGWLPRAQAPAIRAILTDLDRTLAGFVRGQGTVCLVLGAFYGIGLTLTGLDFGLLVGLGTGLISFIPYFGMLIGMLGALAIALAQFADWIPIALVLLVFAAGQILEAVFMTPKLVGDKVGLHPVWVIFALMAGGAAFGFTGLLLAVPVAAAIGVLVRHFLARYLASDLYASGISSGDGDGES
jgi:predicted PurR-regulated permease PerM